MGLLRDAISQSLQSTQAKNGFNGPQVPFMSKPRPSRSRDIDMSYRRVQQDWSYQQDRARMPIDIPNEVQQSIDPSPPRYEELYTPRRYRPLALPQITHGDGQPFLRAYSDELQDHGISQEAFVSIVDKINIAIIPNPEVQIFQKGASIAGWFIPGAASLGLMAGQIVVGAGNAFGHASLVSRTLAKANLALFLPRGLELCIGSSQNVDEEAGLRPMQQSMGSNQPPEWRVAAYGDALAPITGIWPEASQGGRRDPIAAVGRALGQKASSKKLEKAQEDMAKGKFKKMNRLETGLKWLIVRQARPETLAHWQSVLQESEAALRHEQDAQQHNGTWKDH